MKKIPGVESVDVSLEKAVTDIQLKAGNTVTLAQIRDIIRSSGFNAREANVTAVGRFLQRGDQLLLDLAPAKMLLTVDSPAAGAVAAEARRLGASGTGQVTVRGLVKQGEALTLTGIEQR
jgi:hypothetical protein